MSHAVTRRRQLWVLEVTFYFFFLPVLETRGGVFYVVTTSFFSYQSFSLSCLFQSRSILCCKVCVNMISEMEIFLVEQRLERNYSSIFLGLLLLPPPTPKKHIMIFLKHNWNSCSQPYNLNSIGASTELFQERLPLSIISFILLFKYALEFHKTVRTSSHFFFAKCPLTLVYILRWNGLFLHHYAVDHFVQQVAVLH